MPRPKIHAVLFGLLLAGSLGPVGPGGCRRGAEIHEAQTYFRVPGSSLLLPRLDNWVVDDSVEVPQPDQGGIVLRLVTRNNVPGAPRIEVTREAHGQVPTLLEGWLTRGLREMGQLETSGALRILHVDQQPTHIGSLPAYRVHHEFTSGQKSQQMSLYQVALFVVIDGRGMTISAAGRTELFHPQAGNIAEILDHLVIGTPPAGGGDAIDLGRVGGS